MEQFFDLLPENTRKNPYIYPHLSPNPLQADQKDLHFSSLTMAIFDSPVLLCRDFQPEGFTMEEQQPLEDAGTESPPIQKRSRKQIRGLKRLTKEVLAVLRCQKPMTFKEVVSQVVEQAGKATNNLSVKRRIYDSLNVMLATGLLKRTGNRIMLTGSSPPTCSEQLVELRDRVLEKRKIALKYYCVGSLQRRNERCFETNRKLQFPLVGVLGRGRGKVQLADRQVKLTFKQGIELHGDSELVSRMQDDSREPVPQQLFTLFAFKP